MRFNKTERIAYIKEEIRKSEKFLMEHPNASPDVKDHYNHHIDMMHDILASIE